jgi:hypothetical protein
MLQDVTNTIYDTFLNNIFNVMVWGFCYLRIFKKMHSMSGRSLPTL